MELQLIRDNAVYLKGKADEAAEAYRRAAAEIQKGSEVKAEGETINEECRVKFSKESPEES